MFAEYVQHVMEFRIDKSAPVRKWVVSFAESVGKSHADSLSRIYPVLLQMESDESDLVTKAVVVANTNLYRPALHYLCERKDRWDDNMELLHLSITELKEKVLDDLQHSNEGVRNNVLKFMESFILTFSSPPTQALNILNKQPFCLSDIPANHPVLSTLALEQEATEILKRLVDQLTAGRVSATNLSIIITQLGLIARKRPQYMSTILPALFSVGSCPSNIHPKQFKRVVQTLKNTLMQLFKGTEAEEWHDSIVSKLEDMGYSADVKQAKRIMRDKLRRERDAVKRGKRPGEELAAPSSKKQRVEEKAPPLKTEHRIFLRRASMLPSSMVAEWVEASCKNLQSPPDYTPLPDNVFSSTYVNFLAGLGVSSSHLQTMPTVASLKPDDWDESLASATGFQPAVLEPGVIPAVPVPIFTKSMCLQNAEDAFLRIVSDSTSKGVNRAGKQASALQASIICKLTSHSLAPARFMRGAVLKYILDDFAGRQELALRWLYSLLVKTPEELTKEGESIREKDDQQVKVEKTEDEPKPMDTSAETPTKKTDGANSSPEKGSATSSATSGAKSGNKGALQVALKEYETGLGDILQGLSTEQASEDRLISTFLVEVPLLTKGAMDAVKAFCDSDNQDRVFLGLCTLRDLILQRFSTRALHALLSYTWSTRSEVRSQSVRLVTNKLFHLPNIGAHIEIFAKKLLQKVLDPKTLAHLPEIPAVPDTPTPSSTTAAVPTTPSKDDDSKPPSTASAGQEPNNDVIPDTPMTPSKKTSTLAQLTPVQTNLAPSTPATPATPSTPSTPSDNLPEEEKNAKEEERKKRVIPARAHLHAWRQTFA